VPLLPLSARKGQGMAAWYDWLRSELAAQRARVSAGQTVKPTIQPDGARLHAEVG
jgi:hydrogenase nickel incorporation protein HypB